MPIAKVITAFVGALAGGWMIFDGVHVMLRGKYFGPEMPGPWSILFTRLGIDPFSLGPMFIVLGVSWIVCLIGTLCDQTWAWYGAVAAAVATLWYLPIGTFLALVYLAFLVFEKLSK